MPFLTPTVTDEHDMLATFAAQQIRQLATALHGLDDQQIRAIPTASGMNLAILARHVSLIADGGLIALLEPGAGRGGTGRGSLEGPADLAAGACDPAGVRPSDSAESLIAELCAAADRVERLIRSADLERRIPVPDAPWFPEDLESWPARWVAAHAIEEVARHAGHADIIRESIDGKIAYELNARVDGEPWPPEGWSVPGHRDDAPAATADSREAGADASAPERVAMGGVLGSAEGEELAGAVGLTGPSVRDVLLEQLLHQWTERLRPRLQGMTDEEYLFDPIMDGSAWTVHPRRDDLPEGVIQGGSGEMVIDFAYPEPDPAPFTTIAWRLGHVIVGVLAMRNGAHFGAPVADYMSWEYASTAEGALAQLDEQIARWVEGVRSWTDEDLAQPCGAAEGEWAERSRADLVANIHRELIHHLAEVALLRDLHAHMR